MDLKSSDIVKIVVVAGLVILTAIYLLMGNDGTVFMMVVAILAAISGTFLRFGYDVVKSNNKKGSLTWADAVEMYGTPKIKKRKVKLNTETEKVAKEFNDD